MADPGADLDALLTPTPAGDGRFTVDVPDRWQQGRGAFGGLVLGLLARAGDAVVADPARPLRTLTGEIVGPAQPGAAEIAVEVLRAGSGVTTVAARLVQGGAVQCHAVIAFGKARPTADAAPTLPPPAPPAWAGVPVAALAPPLAPVFTQHVEFRPVGPLPFSGHPDPHVDGWVRFRRPGTRRDGAWLVAMADTYWPALLTTARAPRPAATLTFALETCGDPSDLAPEAPLYYRGRLLAARDGYAIESRELWDERGRLLALNQQTFVVMA